jgi:hypothetical protein
MSNHGMSNFSELPINNATCRCHHPVLCTACCQHTLIHCVLMSQVVRVDSTHTPSANQHIIVVNTLPSIISQSSNPIEIKE